MNIFLATILFSATLINARPQKIEHLEKAPKVPTTKEEMPKFDLTSSSSSGKWWNDFTHAILKLRGGVRVRQELIIEFQEEVKKDNAHPPQPEIKKSSPPQPLAFGTHEEEVPGSLRVGPRGFSAPRAGTTSEPKTGDVGVCSTIISEAGEYKNDGRLYSSPNKYFTLYRPIKIRKISCRHNHPAESVQGRCAVVAYPHGAWIRVSPKDKNLFKTCRSISVDSIESMCWGYIVVPGYCVLQKER